MQGRTKPLFCSLIIFFSSSPLGFGFEWQRNYAGVSVSAQPSKISEPKVAVSYGSNWTNRDVLIGGEVTLKKAVKSGPFDDIGLGAAIKAGLVLEEFSLVYGKAGIEYSKDGMQTRLGVGLEVGLTQDLSVASEYEVSPDITRIDQHEVTGRLRYYFD